MSERIDGTGHFCQQRGIAITIARDHLADAHALCITGKRGSACPAFKSYFLCWDGNRVEVVVEPDRVVAQRVGFLRHARHRLIRLGRVGNTHQVHKPSLRNNYTEIHHEKTPSSLHLSLPVILHNLPRGPHAFPRSAFHKALGLDRTMLAREVYCSLPHALVTAKAGVLSHEPARVAAK